MNTDNFSHTSFPDGIQKVYQKAIIFAAKHHGNQILFCDKIPYVTHLSNVCMEIFVAAAHTPEFDLGLAVPVALLHDVLEDTDCTEAELSANFGADIAAGVRALTKDVTLPKEERMLDSLRRIQAQPKTIWAIKLADRITNLQPPPPHWNAEKISEYKTEAILIYDHLKESNPYLASRLKNEIAQYPPL
ncbi:MAG: HD domain-containing protein [Puniceicoccales bacterium]|jgi:guanosine-3',5'-bis(diphosphate) 3'-pyrophosphohydrolase|nr:HD domain-containing protein [Puniceicoccales bacterium]